MDTYAISQFMHSFIPDAGGMTWGDMAMISCLIALGWASELVKYLAVKNGTLT